MFFNSDKKYNNDLIFPYSPNTSVNVQKEMNTIIGFNNYLKTEIIITTQSNHFQKILISHFWLKLKIFHINKYINKKT